MSSDLASHNPASAATDSGPVVIGVLTWNRYDVTRACVASLAKLRGWPIRVVVVDNGSREPEGERLAAEFGEPVEAVTLPENRLAPGGYNAIIRSAAERGATHVLVLNNDTQVTDPHMLDRLLAASGPDIAAVGPLVFTEDGSLFSAGGTLGRWSGRANHLRRHQMPHSDRPYEVPWLDGPCLLINIKVACSIGGLDPTFVSTWDELDWCVRASKMGYRCVVEPRTSIQHRVGATIPSRQRERYLMRNSILFARRHASWPQTITAILCFVFLTVPERAAHGFPNLRNVAQVLGDAASAIQWNVADALRRRTWHRSAWGPAVCTDLQPGE